ncbi:MAG: PIN domain-containing protein [Burkholderiales bacterium]|nr:PIN domain-containing protein [Burkholderiales bacterium]MDE1927862.1 PIN domain-containing protein [Burkholderiales bacterium]MDE2157855.1 PIN domain-containing protein [Burkholderiales bacterium]MDE2503851.1 PIN domain-containing protein [Burkholderiales bacterium]
MADDRPAPGAAALVLDTNSVLDWLVFRDPSMRAAADAVESGRLRWIACPRMRDELARALTYASLSRWKPDSEHVLSKFDQHAEQRTTPPTLPGLRCHDADDQVFIDLAVAAGARWLITRDQALLKLARRAAPLGVIVLRPADFAADA